MKTAFIIIARHHAPSTISFAESLARLTEDEIWLVPDLPLEIACRGVRCAYVSDEEARGAGFSRTTSPQIPKDPTAWDKVLYLLASGMIVCDFAWIVEDDVFFSKPEIARDLIERYRPSQVDLMLPRFFRPDERPHWFYWNSADVFPFEERAGGLLAISRFSQRTILECRNFGVEHGSLCFLEVMFPSLAIRCGLTVEKLDFLTERRFRFRPEFAWWEIAYKIGDRLENGVFHPVKSDDLRLRLMSQPSKTLIIFKILTPVFELRVASRRIIRKVTWSFNRIFIKPSVRSIVNLTGDRASASASRSSGRPSLVEVDHPDGTRTVHDAPESC